MKDIQISLLNHIENSDLIQFFEDDEILKNKFELKSVLYMILNISNNYHRQTNFFDKIFKVISAFSDLIKKYYTNYEIFNIFKSNNKIILFLIEEKIIIIDDSIANTIISNDKKIKFFYPEIKTYLDEKTNRKILKEIHENHEKMRKIGENDSKVCELIRNDSVDEFIAYVKQENLDLNSSVHESIFETNSLLIKKVPTLIEYAAFFGSMKIFNYLYLNQTELTPSLWIYAIHSQKIELIRFLKEKQIFPQTLNFGKYLNESIKCHHNEIAKFFLKEYFNNDEDSCDIFTKSLKHFNFVYIRKEKINEALFYNLCYYDYFILVDILLKTKNIDINSRRIFLLLFFNSIQQAFFFFIQFRIYF